MFFIGFFIAFWVPETLQKANSEPPRVDETTPPQDNRAESGREYVFQRIRVELKKLQGSASFVRRNTNIILILLCFVISYLGRQAIPLILQYGPKKFHWTIAQVKKSGE